MAQDKFSDPKQKTAEKTTMRCQSSEFSFSHHGLAHMSEATSSIAWFFWLVFTIAMLVPMVLFIRQSLLGFLAFEVNTRMERANLRRPALPVVTICPKSPFKKKEFIEFLHFYEATKDNETWARYPNDALYFVNEAADMLLHGGERRLHLNPHYFMSHLFHFHPEIHSQLSWTCEETLVIHTYQMAKSFAFNYISEKICEEWEVTPHAFYGSCFRFNMNQTAVAHSPGASDGIKIIAVTADYNFIDVFDILSTWSGFRIMLTGPKGDFRIAENGRDIGLGQSVQIALKKESLQKVTQFPWSNCTSEYPKELRNMSVIHRKKVYSLETCNILCLLKFVLEKFACLVFLYEEAVSLGEIYSGVRACEYEEMLEGLFEVMPTCEKICQPACFSESWRQEILTEPIPPILEQEKFDYLSKANNFTKFSVAVINIFYADMHETRVVESPAKLPEDLIGEIGGQLGLWCGMSIMTVFELFIVCFVCGRRRISGNQVQTVQG